VIKTFSLAAATCALLAIPAVAPSASADENIEYPATRPNYPFQRSRLTGRAVVIPPYRHVFPIRVFSTPQQPPYYNVPPYAVISPY
jgi:hypothetical protein